MFLFQFQASSTETKASQVIDQVDRVIAVVA